MQRRSSEPRPGAFRPRAGARQSAFTMVELMVVMAIISILLATVIANYGSFRSATVATNMAYEVGTVVRQAQLYGLGVRKANSDFGGTYGVEFADGSPTYTIFRDADLDGSCGEPCNCSDPLSECVEQVTMLQGVTVEAVCAGDSVSTSDLLADASACSNSSLTVSFTRPNPEGVVRYGAAGNVTGSHALGAVLLRGGTHCRLVRVYANGQISVEGVSGGPDGEAGGTVFEDTCNG